MFIELTEALRCPRPHDESYLVCIPLEMDGRQVVRGGLGCPVCQAEFPIVEGTAWFAPPGKTAPPRPDAVEPEYDAAALRTFVDLEGRGGYVALVGGAARHAASLADLLEGVHVAAVNPPDDAPRSAAISVLMSPAMLPLKSRHLRAVVIGADYAASPWTEEAARALLPGLRAVIADAAVAVTGLAELARGAGLFIGERR
ncbi:MAG TPA: hypothetical protein VNL98_09745 [Gemmatimonadales bacterium]|nr:hypothetical protein [Gemmatimonadales bacterium]